MTTILQNTDSTNEPNHSRNGEPKMSARKEALLAAAREQLTTEKEARSNGGVDPDAGPEIRYRGQVLKTGAAGTPGSGIRRTPSRSTGGDDVRAALQKVKDLYHDGLISRAEAEKKRSEILGRL